MRGLGYNIIRSPMSDGEKFDLGVNIASPLSQSYSFSLGQIRCLSRLAISDSITLLWSILRTIRLTSGSFLGNCPRFSLNFWRKDFNNNSLACFRSSSEAKLILLLLINARSTTAPEERIIPVQVPSCSGKFCWRSKGARESCRTAHRGILVNL